MSTWGSLSVPRAKRLFEQMTSGGDFSPRKLRPDDKHLRDQLLEALQGFAGAREYEKDLQVGFAAYRLLSPDKIGLRRAADDSFWRHVALVVMPDIVFQRTGKASEEWFWKSRWRLWPKRPWWYVHLCWQGDERSTRKAIAGMSTDAIAQLVERSGRQGFRIDTWRAIAAELGRRKTTEKDLRRVMKLNTVLLSSIEPSWVEGGEATYAARLFNTLEIPLAKRRGRR